MSYHITSVLFLRWSTIYIPKAFLSSFCCFCPLDELKYWQTLSLDIYQFWFILPALKLVPSRLVMPQPRGSNSNAGKMDQAWSRLYVYWHWWNLFAFSLFLRYKFVSYDEVNLKNIIELLLTKYRSSSWILLF